MFHIWYNYYYFQWNFLLLLINLFGAIHINWIYCLCKTEVMHSITKFETWSNVTHEHVNDSKWWGKVKIKKNGKIWEQISQSWIYLIKLLVCRFFILFFFVPKSNRLCHFISNFFQYRVNCLFQTETLDSLMCIGIPNQHFPNINFHCIQ